MGGEASSAAGASLLHGWLVDIDSTLLEPGPTFASGNFGSLAIPFFAFGELGVLEIEAFSLYLEAEGTFATVLLTLRPNPAYVYDAMYLYSLVPNQRSGGTTSVCPKAVFIYSLSARPPIRDYPKVAPGTSGDCAHRYMNRLWQQLGIRSSCGSPLPQAKVPTDAHHFRRLLAPASVTTFTRWHLRLKTQHKERSR